MKSCVTYLESVTELYNNFKSEIRLVNLGFEGICVVHIRGRIVATNKCSFFEVTLTTFTHAD